MSEEWGAIPEHDGYEVSTHGRVRSLDRDLFYSNGKRVRRAGQLLALTPDADGYMLVSLGRTAKRKVHALVLTVFAGPKPPGTEARHANNVRSDNRIENLSWSTHLDNVRDQVLHGTRSKPGSLTHCRKAGHPYDNENTYLTRGGHKVCRECQRARQKEDA